MQDILVVKLGGGSGLDLESACHDLAQIATQRPLVIVHGVSEEMNRLCEMRGIQIQTLHSPSGHSSRYTTPQVRDIYVEAARNVNQQIISYLAESGVRALGLDAPVCIHAERKNSVRAVIDGRVRIIRDDFSGAITGVNPAAIHEALVQGLVPVIPPMAISPDGLLNVDGDRASAAIAGELGAETLIILSNVRGLYRAYPDENSTISHVSMRELTDAMQWAQGRMKRKVLSAQEALEHGVMRVVISDGRIGRPATLALNGEGTVFTS